MAECFHLKYLCFPMSGRQCLKLESRACIGSRLKTRSCEQRSEKSPHFVL